MMSLQTQSTHNCFGLLLHPEQIIRLDFESDKPLLLDDVHAIDALISRADRTFTYNTENIRGLLAQLAKVNNNSEAHSEFQRFLE